MLCRVLGSSIGSRVQCRCRLLLSTKTPATVATTVSTKTTDNETQSVLDRPRSVSSLQAQGDQSNQQVPSHPQVVSINTIRAKYKAGQKITMITAYDYPSAAIVDRAGIDMILVGDSLGMVVLGYNTTVPVELHHIIHHCRAVARGASRPYLIGDMPFGTYLTPEDALRTAARILKEGRMGAVKLEGGIRVIPQVKAIVSAEIPVMGHIGLTPQTISALGGFKVQGKSAKAASELVDSALALQDAGCFSIVLESVPDRIAHYITKKLDIPTIGIGAGPGTSGQVQVFHDVIGLFDRFLPKFSHRYAHVGKEIHRALTEFNQDVTAVKFPAKEHSFIIKNDEFKEFMRVEELKRSGEKVITNKSSHKEEEESEVVEGLYGKTS